MPSYRYKAVDDAGKLFKGVLNALDEVDVERNLSHSGLSLIQAHRLKKSSSSNWLGGSVPLRSIVEFYHRLAQTLEIGLPMLSALEENSRYLPSRTMRQIAGELMVAVESGRTLYEAMQVHHKVFQKLDLAIIRMGEQSGVLPACLKQLASFLVFFIFKGYISCHFPFTSQFEHFSSFFLIACL